MPGNVSSAVSAGIFGKLPTRGDFVRSGLPRDFVDRWDTWLSGVMAATREQAGDAWLPAFLEAPIWRFTLPAGLCGTGAVLGLMMPSVDRAGRYFPLTLAAVGAVPRFAIDAAAEAWLDRCEVAGLAALEKDEGPEDIMARLGVPDLTAGDGSIRVSEWWTDGSPRVTAGRVTAADLPSPATYAAMLGTASDAEHLVKARQVINPLE
ncbi:MAG: type VI secretion system-associated protein TagF [Rhodopila sp.]|jgi:type VI secretion system protein ImpM